MPNRKSLINIVYFAVARRTPAGSGKYFLPAQANCVTIAPLTMILPKNGNDLPENRKKLSCRDEYFC